MPHLSTEPSKWRWVLFSEEELYAKIGVLVRINRERIGLTQYDLAKLAGLTRTSITNIEAGNQKIRVHTLFNIAIALGVSPETILPLQIQQNAEVIDENLVDSQLDKPELDWVQRILKS